MCYRITQYSEYSCGHQFVIRQQIVDCNQQKCRFSGMHDSEYHSCAATCAQRLLPDQAIITDTLARLCPRCGSMANGH
ncbi:hypothetical protein PAXRUDRAFT_493888 [Paxillus rubicundulus Ve08.2h10]|uniref:Unplaced genomic scaffold scaffold_335, whole genome shotgun sequence n=1 Tax=Paxillus rubicundulus Ve08.2h10 TaxID=930991 RepID=A0A0D0E779_9AGAM|nr:hypothetical protein PAXRUDRAFT_493888 [Paxillus rubicundulus Ve08.2h10]